MKTRNAAVSDQSPSEASQPGCRRPLLARRRSRAQTTAARIARSAVSTLALWRESEGW